MDENTFCQGSEDKTLRIWDARTSNVVLDFPKQKYILVLIISQALCLYLSTYISAVLYAIVIYLKTFPKNLEWFV